MFLKNLCVLVLWTKVASALVSLNLIHLQGQIRRYADFYVYLSCQQFFLEFFIFHRHIVQKPIFDSPSNTKYVRYISKSFLNKIRVSTLLQPRVLNVSMNGLNWFCGLMHMFLLLKHYYEHRLTKWKIHSNNTGCIIPFNRYAAGGYLG